MTTPTDTQTANNGTAVVESSSAEGRVASPASASQSPGSDLSNLLKEYEKSTPTPISTADFSRFIKAIEPIATSVQDDMRVKAEEAEQAFVSETVKRARGDTIPEDKAPLVDGYIRHRIQTDPKVLEALTNRFKNPDGWNQFLTQANGELTKLLPGQTTNDVRTDIERAAAAVRGVSTSPPTLEHPDAITAFNMSDRDWETHKARVRAANQSG